MRPIILTNNGGEAWKDADAWICYSITTPLLDDSARFEHIRGLVVLLVEVWGRLKDGRVL